MFSIEKDWKKDKQGRYYREVRKGLIEYRPMVETAEFGTIFEDTTQEEKERMRQKAKERERAMLEQQKQSLRPCPLHMPQAGGAWPTCNHRCKAWDGDACRLDDDVQGGGDWCHYRRATCYRGCPWMDDNGLCKMLSREAR